MDQNSEASLEFNYFDWFKKNHLDNLKTISTELSNTWNHLYKTEDRSIDSLNKVIALLDACIKLENYLPETRGGKQAIQKLKSYREVFSKKEFDDTVFWSIQEAKSHVFSIYNYMDALCD